MKKRMRKILLITAGGSIISDRCGNDALQPVPFSTPALHKVFPELPALADIEVEEVFREDTENFTEKHWSVLAAKIQDNLQAYDGFIITTGDTILFTSAALAFCFRDLRKPIVLCTSNISIFDRAAYGRTTLRRCVLAAVQPQLRGVYIVSGDELIWGTRARKYSDMNSLFVSSGLSHAGIFNTDGLKLSAPLIANKSSAATGYQPHFNPNIVVRHLYPGFDPADLLYTLIGKKPAAYLIIAYGTGCLPNRGDCSLIPFLKEAFEADIPVFSCSSTINGRTSLEQWGIGREQHEQFDLIETFDMTPASAITKLMWVTAKTKQKEEIISLMKCPIAKELTSK